MRPGPSSQPGAGSNGGPAGWGLPPQQDSERIPAEAARELWQAVAAEHARDRSRSHRLCSQLVTLDRRVMDSEAERVLLSHVGQMWRSGWQPAELVRQGRLGCTNKAAGRLVAHAVAVDHAGRRAAMLDPRWTAQVESLGLPSTDGRPGWIASALAAEGLDRLEAVTAMVDAIAGIQHLPHLDPILDPPGSASNKGAAGGQAFGARPVGAETDPVLGRIRSLLAKAESTTFEAEATAFTAKAQELMTRHAIDAALLEGVGEGDDQVPVATRMPIDAPYADAKSLLLQTVAEAGRCRSVFHHRLALSTVVGLPADVSAVELLFTSLLLQAQSAMAEAARRAPAGTRTRSQSYRSAFLLGYTQRIGDRLKEINDAVLAEAEAEHGSSFLPVLRSHADIVDDFAEQRFGKTVASRVRGGYDAAGWVGGRLAAEQAKLNAGDLVAPGGSSSG